MPKVCAIIVTYKPDKKMLEELVRLISAQVCGFVIVDNGADIKFLGGLVSEYGDKSYKLISMGSNVGLAAAQNRGASYAFEQGFTHVVLLDQDSIPGLGMISNMLKVEKMLVESGERVAAVGPQVIDERTNQKFPFCRVGVLRTQKTLCPKSAEDEYCATDFLISSGSLIGRGAWMEVGGVDEDLFIDNLDVDWCYRAKSKGYRCFGVFSAKLRHRLGDKVVYLFGGALALHVHTPERLYFIMRNRVMLYKRKEIPLSWKSNDFLRLIVKFVLFSVCISPYMKNSRSMLAGIKDGFVNRVNIKRT